MPLTPPHLGLARRVGVIAAWIGLAVPARAEVPRACVDAVERGQSLRDQVKLTLAREAFLVCAASPCPEVIQRGCAQWLAELETRIPTVVVTATDAEGRDVLYATVLVDGAPWKDRLDGIATPIDPGIHVVRIERPGAPPFEQSVVIREAEKLQKQRFVVPVAAPHAPAAVAPIAAPVAPPAARSGLPGGAIVAASVAGAAALSFAGFAIAGAVDVHDLDGSCSPRCSPDAVAGAHRDLVAADVSLGVGVAALAVATWLYFEWRARPTSPIGAEASDCPLTVRF